jgi:hypothetical protein
MHAAVEAGVPADVKINSCCLGRSAGNSAGWRCMFTNPYKLFAEEQKCFAILQKNQL